MNQESTVRKGGKLVPDRTRLTILDLRDSPWVDGPGRTIIDCGESLNACGFRFFVGTFSHRNGNPSTYTEEARKRNIEVLTLHEAGQFDWRVVRQLYQFMQSVRIDVVHTHDLRSNLVGLICARLHNIPVVTTVHGWIANTPKRKLYRLIDKFLLRFFDQVITVSKHTKQLVVQALVPKKNITVVENALHIDQYLVNRNANFFREELGLKQDTILIGNIGRLSPEKGHIEFLRAGKEVVRQHPNVKLVIIGVGDELESLQNFVTNNQMTENVIFAGFRRDMLNVYNSLDLVVQSSYTEGMPNVVLEALLMRVPVIATDVGGTSEIIENGRTGVLVSPGQTQNLVNAILNYLQNPELFHAMAVAGGQVVREKFDHRLRVDRLAAIYRQLVGRQIKN